jgi:peroxiredoxin
LQIQFKTSTMRLEDIPLDIGYASEQVTLTKEDGQTYDIAGQNGKTQLIITVPFINEPLITELKEIADLIPKEEKHEVTASLIVAKEGHQDPKLEGFDFLIDSKGEFGDWYGLRLVDGPLEGEFTKAVTLISKDGALFYDEYPANLDDPFKHDTLLRKIAAAQTCYTGKGCH